MLNEGGEGDGAAELHADTNALATTATITTRTLISVLLRKFMTVLAVGLVCPAVIRTPLLRAILHVLLMSPGEQMKRIDARWIVAGVANLLTLWYTPMSQHERNSVRPLLPRCPHNKYSVTLFIFASRPEPATAFNAIDL